MSTKRETKLDLFDIQGNIMQNFAEKGFIKARYLFLEIKNGNRGREFVTKIKPLITTSARWTNDASDPYGTTEPSATSNISFTYNALKKLGLPILSLHSFPDEFAIGMRGRRAILGDNYSSDPENWDPVWNTHDVEVHMLISIEAKNMDNLEERYNKILSLVAETNGGVILFDGSLKDEDGKEITYQDAHALDNEAGQPTAKEHFGYTDGISNPYFKGMLPGMGSVIGGGKKNPKALGIGEPKGNQGNPILASTWAPLETGEFILGHEDEAQEYPACPTPPLLGKNGSFMVYRKLHENVGMFNDMLEKTGADYPGGKEGLASKFAGRWRNGAPLATFPNEEDGKKN